MLLKTDTIENNVFILAISLKPPSDVLLHNPHVKWQIIKHSNTDGRVTVSHPFDTAVKMC